MEIALSSETSHGRVSELARHMGRSASFIDEVELTAGAHRMQHAVPLWAAENVLLGAVSKGYSREQLHARLGLSSLDAADEQARVPMDRFSTLCRQLSREMRDELIGLWHSPVPPGSFVMVARQMVSCRTLGESMRTGLRLYRLICPGFPLRMQLEGGLCWLRVDEAGSSPKRLALHCASTYWALSMARWLVERQIPVMQACMQSPRQDARYVEPEPFFEVPARYGMRSTGVAFDGQWLRRPVLRQPESLREFLRSAPADLLRRHSIVPNIADQVRAQLRALRHQRLPSIDELASKLGLSPRSLHRRLAAEGVNFQSFKDAVRRDMAMTWLGGTELSIAEVGDRLGFSDPSAFHRSFKRWTGVSPGSYRRSARPESTSGPNEVQII